MKDFRSYQGALSLYRLLRDVQMPRHLKDQLDRASASVCLNLAEGYGRRTFQDKRKFYQYALASLREVQAVLDLLDGDMHDARTLAQGLGGALYKLCHWSP